MYFQESALTIRREKYAKSIRKKQIDSYMQTIRNKMIKIEKQEERELPTLIPQKLRYIKEVCIQGNYKEDVVRQALVHLSQHSRLSLAKSKVVMFLSKCLASMQPQSQNHHLLHQILTRIIDYGIYQTQSQYHSALQDCYQEMIDILYEGGQKTLKLWKNLSAVYNEAFYQRRVITFLTQVESFNELEFQDQAITLILQVFTNFTHNPFNKRFDGSLLCKILTKLQIILNHLELGQSDFQLALNCIYNMLAASETKKNNTYLIMESDVPVLLLDYFQTSKQLKIQSKIHLLYIYMQILADKGDYNNKLDELIPKLRLLLPYPSIQANFQMKHIPMLDGNRQITISALQVLNNYICGNADERIFIKSQDILRCFILLARCGIIDFQYEVATILYNLLIVCSLEFIEIMCEQGLLQSLTQLILQEFNIECKIVSLKTLRKLLLKMERTPKNNLAWYFNVQKIKKCIAQNGIKNYIESLIVGKNQECSQIAEQIIKICEGDYQSKE